MTRTFRGHPPATSLCPRIVGGFVPFLKAADEFPGLSSDDWFSRRATIRIFDQA